MPVGMSTIEKIEA